MAKSLFSQLYFIDNFMLNEWGETGNPVLKQEQGLSATYALGYILYKEFISSASHIVHIIVLRKMSVSLYSFFILLASRHKSFKDSIL